MIQINFKLEVVNHLLLTVRSRQRIPQGGGVVATAFNLVTGLDD